MPVQEMDRRIRADMAEIKARLRMLPTTAQLFWAIFLTFGLSVALVLGAIKVATP
jgi:hypothetical protein